MPTDKFVFDFAWSPDGSRLRVAVGGFNAVTNYWEVSAEGKNLRQLPAVGTTRNDAVCCGHWTSDEKHFVFLARGQVWEFPRSRGFSTSGPKPVQLTSSPLAFQSMVLGKDSKKLFVVGQTFRGESMRYEARIKQFVPFLGGISAEFMSFSKDGQWVAYVLYPEGTLWRSKLDGSERVQLSYPPNRAFLPRWSPDGKNVVYYDLPPEKPSRIFEISSDGGSPQALMPDDPKPQVDPNWSPDGGKIVFGGQSNEPGANIRILDLATHQVTNVPGSQGLFSPRWSADGRYMIGMSSDLARLLLFDVQTQKWHEIAKGVGFPNWSRDGSYVYVLDNNAPIVWRIRVSDGKTEQAVNISNFRLTGVWTSALSLAPDDSPILLRNAGTTDVYSIDLQER